MKYFSTTQARKMFGMTRKDLRANKNVICLGAFPNNHGSLECLWTIHDDLNRLIKESRKAVRKGEPVDECKDKIEAIINELFGFTKVEEPTTE